MTPYGHNPSPACRACGRPWTEHLGCEELCRELRKARAEVERLRAERAASIDVICRAVNHAEAILQENNGVTQAK